jgi:hypothetical protein
VLLGFAGAGDTLGELSLLDRTPRSATVHDRVALEGYAAVSGS